MSFPWDYSKFSGAFFTQKKFSTALSSSLPFWFPTFFQYLIFCSILLILKPKLFLNGVLIDKNRLLIVFLFFENFGREIWDLNTWRLFFGTRQRKYANKSDGNCRARCYKLFEFHPLICFAFITNSFHPSFNTVHFQRCTWTKNSYFCLFPDLFCYHFPANCSFSIAMKITQRFFAEE